MRQQNAFSASPAKQVKIRAFCIELPRHRRHRPFPRCQSGAAHRTSDYDPDAPAEPELLAYVVTADGAAAPSAPDLRAFLASRLPEYMVPARFVGIDALPLTINGKLDESALPAKAAENLLRGQGEPAGGGAGSVEEQLAAIVASLLKLPTIEPTENIFLVGGHSMLAMQLLLRIRQAFGVNLALRQVFEASDFGDALSPEIREAEERMRDHLLKQSQPPGSKS